MSLTRAIAGRALKGSVHCLRHTCGYRVFLAVHKSWNVKKFTNRAAARTWVRQQMKKDRLGTLRARP